MPSIEDSKEKNSTNSETICPDPSKVLIWLIGLSILAGLTLKDFLPLLYQYQFHNVATQIRVITKNDSIKPPYVVLCTNRGPSSIPDLSDYIYNNKNMTKCSFCNSMINNSWDVWNSNFSYPGNSRVSFENALMSAFIKKLALDTTDDNFEYLKAPNLNWNKPIVDALLNMFACVNKMDADTDYGSSGKYIRDCLDRYKDFGLFNKWKVEKLFNKLFSLLCVNIHVNYGPFNHVSLETVPGSLLTVYPDSFCASLPMSEVGFNLSVDRTDQNFDPPTSGADDWTSMLDSSPWIQLNSEPDIVWPTRDPGQILFNSDRSSKASKLGGLEKIYVTYSIETTVVEKRPGVKCYNENTPSTCIHSCLIDVISANCRCVPFTARNLSDQSISIDLPFCLPAIYSNCTLDKEKETNKCADQCTNPCRYVSYRWNIATYIQNGDGPKRFWVNVKPIITPIVEFSIVPQDTPEQFLSRVGALVNFYLGVSGLSLIALMFAAIRIIKLWFRSRRGKSPDALREISNLERGLVRIELREIQTNAAPVVVPNRQSPKQGDVMRHDMVTELKSKLEKNMRKISGRNQRY